MDLAIFRAQPVLGILRGIAASAVDGLAEAVARSGLKACEITMNTPDAPALIRRMVASARGRFAVGAGTVLDLRSLDEALAAGATFIVMPVVVEEVVASCVGRGVPVFPGALTPQEVYRAWRLGASMVKVFPASVFGPEYFRELKGPFRDIELLACGGVTPETMPAYRASGASAVAFGGSVFRKDWIEREDFSAVERAIRRFTAVAGGADA